MRKKRGGPRLLNTSRMRVRDSESRAASIQLKSVFEASVKGLADTGNGIVEHPEGLLFFVSGVWTGERVRVSVHSLKSRFGIGELVEVLEPSSDRVSAPCPHQGVSSSDCGGCSWMTLSYSAQLSAKHERVQKAIARVDPNCLVPPILSSAQSLGYRVRAQLKTDGKKLGFVANGERQLVEVDDCIILTQSNRTTLASLRSELPKTHWAPSSRKHRWTTLDIDESCNAQSVSVNQRLPFQQANDQQNTVMKQWLSQKLQSLERGAKVVELFAGSGNFTDVLSELGFNDIVAVEVVQEAIDALNDRRLNGVRALCYNLFDKSTFEAFIKKYKDAEVLVLDPPRDGLKIKDGLFSQETKIKDVFYISCDLSTLCRDLRDFIDNDYQLIEVQPLDLMPQTPHVEMLCHLQRGP